MKHIPLFLLLLTLLPAAHAQMGINTPTGLSPRQDLEIYTRNGFLVQQKFIFTTADPNASINTLSCATSPANLTDPAGILKDPGGDSNYPASLTCTQVIGPLGGLPGNSAGFEVVFEDLDTEAGQDLVIITFNNGQSVSFSGTSLPAPFFVADDAFTVRFQANSNGTVGRGFRLHWRVVFRDATTPTTPNTAFGNALQFDANKGALLGGYLLTGAVQRAGQYSTALGYQNTASGQYSSALGYLNTASGYSSTVLGTDNTASGDYSSALGYLNTASGNYSSALGSLMSTGGQKGSFAIGDSDPLRQGTTTITVADQFVARFRNGYYLLTSGNTSASRTGVVIGAGQNAWGSISDSTRKERLLPIDQPDLLRKIGAMTLSTWNYKGQREIRHYGPMAQDFYAAFGHDGLGQVGCDTLIYSHDFAGVTFAGVQALIRENQQLKAKLTGTEAKLRQMESQTNAKLSQMESQTNTKLEQANARLEALEQALFVRRRGRAVVGRKLRTGYAPKPE